MKKTNKKITFQVLNDYFLYGKQEINIEHLNDCVYIIFDIEYRHENGGNGKSKLHYKLINKYLKNQDLIKEAFLRFAEITYVFPFSAMKPKEPSPVPPRA